MYEVATCSFLVSFKSLFSLYVLKLNCEVHSHQCCIQLHQAAVFSKRSLLNSTQPDRHEAGGGHSYRLAGQHSEAFRSYRLR